MSRFLSWLKRIFYARPAVGEKKHTPLETVDFSLRQEVNQNDLGSMVLLVRTRNDGEIEKELMPIIQAQYDLFNDPGNGEEGGIYKSGHIEYVHVYAGDWDQSA
jgi:hypothetical protein